MSYITLEVDFIAGASFLEAVQEAKTKARQLNVAYIRFNFNGCIVSIGQNADIDKVLLAYPKEKVIVSA